MVAYDRGVIRLSRLEPRRVVLGLIVTILALAVTTPIVALLEDRLGVLDASAVYLLAVVAVGVTSGTIAAALTAFGAFLLYDFLFIDPRYTLTVAAPAEWLNLVLLLVVGIVVGQLAAAQRNRADAAEIREREARVLFQLSFALATRDDTKAALASIVDTLRTATAMVRVWIWLGPDGTAGVLGADTDPAGARGRPSSYATLRRMPGDEPAHWVRVHDPVVASRSSQASREGATFRVGIDAAGRTLGAMWAQRAQMAGSPTDDETRMLAAAADQIGQALEQDRLRAESNSAELARRSDAMKSALLDSVSHDLRTPLASIRAAAGSLMDSHLTWSPEELRSTARTIDEEAERLNRLVTNLLDMSRDRGRRAARRDRAIPARRPRRGHDPAPCTAGRGPEPGGDHAPGPAARRGRPHLHGPDPGQRHRECLEVRPRRSAHPDRRRSRARIVRRFV